MAASSYTPRTGTRTPTRPVTERGGRGPSPTLLAGLVSALLVPLALSFAFIADQTGRGLVTWLVEVGPFLALTVAAASAVYAAVIAPPGEGGVRAPTAFFGGLLGWALTLAVGAVL